MRPDDDIFGCFGNTCSEILLALTWPCLLYGEEIHRHNANGTSPLGFWTGCLCYGCFHCCPCVPGTYLRTIRRENAFEGCLSYCFCPCCALLQDLRRLKETS